MTFLQIAPLTGYSAPTNQAGYGGVISSFTVGRTGQYLVAFTNTSNPDGNGNHWVNYSLIIAGTTVLSNIPTAIGIGVPSYGGNYWQGHIVAGQTVQLVGTQNGGATNGGGTMVAYFIPTPAERA